MFNWNYFRKFSYEWGLLLSYVLICLLLILSLWGCVGSQQRGNQFDLNADKIIDIDAGRLKIFPKGIDKLPYVVLIGDIDSKLLVDSGYNELIERACDYWNILLGEVIFLTEEDLLQANDSLLLLVDTMWYSEKVGVTYFIGIDKQDGTGLDIIATSVMLNLARFEELNKGDQLGVLKHELGHVLGLKHTKNGLMKKSFKPGKNNWGLDVESESMLRQALTLKRED